MRAEIPSLASLCLCSQALCHSFVDNSTHLLTIFHKCFICGHLQFQICFTSAQQRVTKAGLRPPSLERLVCKLSAGLCVGTWRWFPAPRLTGEAHCGWAAVQTVWLTLTTCLPPGSLWFGYVQGNSCFRDQPPAKCLGSESLKSFWWTVHTRRHRSHPV